VTGGSPEDWVAKPRTHHQFLPDVLQYESAALTALEVRALEAKGHSLKVIEDGFGNMQAILWDRNAERVQAASDPRGLGVAEVR